MTECKLHRQSLLLFHESLASIYPMWYVLWFKRNLYYIYVILNIWTFLQMKISFMRRNNLMRKLLSTMSHLCTRTAQKLLFLNWIRLIFRLSVFSGKNLTVNHLRRKLCETFMFFMTFQLHSYTLFLNRSFSHSRGKTCTIHKLRRSLSYYNKIFSYYNNERKVDSELLLKPDF